MHAEFVGQDALKVFATQRANRIFCGRPGFDSPAGTVQPSHARIKFRNRRERSSLFSIRSSRFDSASGKCSTMSIVNSSIMRIEAS
jgi:hypothetical protein